MPRAALALPVRTKWAGHTRIGSFRFRPAGEVRLGLCLCMKCNIIIDL